MLWLCPYPAMGSRTQVSLMLCFLGGLSGSASRAICFGIFEALEVLILELHEGLVFVHMF